MHLEDWIQLKKFFLIELGLGLKGKIFEPLKQSIVTPLPQKSIEMVDSQLFTSRDKSSEYLTRFYTYNSIKKTKNVFFY